MQFSVSPKLLQSYLQCLVFIKIKKAFISTCLVSYNYIIGQFI